MQIWRAEVHSYRRVYLQLIVSVTRFYYSSDTLAELLLTPPHCPSLIQLCWYSHGLFTWFSLHQAQLSWFLFHHFVTRSYNLWHYLFFNLSSSAVPCLLISSQLPSHGLLFLFVCFFPMMSTRLFYAFYFFLFLQICSIMISCSVYIPCSWSQQEANVCNYHNRADLLHLVLDLLLLKFVFIPGEQILSRLTGPYMDKSSCHGTMLQTLSFLLLLLFFLSVSHLLSLSHWFQ